MSRKESEVALLRRRPSGVKHGEYETLVYLGIAERRTETLYAPSGRVSGSRASFRLAETAGR